jgi:hypothetical protein
MSMSKVTMAAMALCGAAFFTAPAQAGCLTGAAVGGIAGHVVGHGVVGAAAGCAIGHSHSKSKQDKNASSNQPPATNPDNQGRRP